MAGRFIFGGGRLLERGCLFKEIQYIKCLPFRAAMVGTGNVSILNIKEGKSFRFFMASSGLHSLRKARSRPFE